MARFREDSELDLMKQNIASLQTGKQDAGSYAPSSHTHAISDVTGLQAALDEKPTLDSSGHVPISLLPAIAITSIQSAANQTAMLALTAQMGDVVIRTDENNTYIHNGGTSGTMADYTALLFPTAAVSSVHGRTGVVAAASGDYNTSQVTESTNLYFTNQRAQAAAKMISGVTVKTGAFPVVKKATVASGNAVFHLTDDGTSTGAALFPNGVDLDSVQLCAVDGTAPCSYGAPALSNSNKTLTVAVNKAVGVTVLGITVLGSPTAANGTEVRLLAFGN